MSLGPARTAIRTYLTANFTTIPTIWENERLSDAQRAASAFMLAEVHGVAVAFTQASIADVGSRLFRDPGVILLTIFVPYGSGLTTVEGYLTTLSGLLLRKDIAAPSVPDIVRTEDPIAHPGERDDQDGKLYRATLSTSFEYYHSA